MNDSHTELDARSRQLFDEHRQTIFRRTDRMFAVLMLLQWVGGIAAAIWISPMTWDGTISRIHMHVWAAVCLGTLITALPVYLALFHSGAALTRFVIAVAQMAMSALLIHLSGGRIETHFHVFGSLAFLACYRDWRILIPATLAIGLDHLIRGIYWPQSVFGVLSASPWRAFEHAAWVAFEDIFLIISIVKSVEEMRNIASQRASLESTNATIENEVRLRTEEITRAQEKLLAQSEELRQSETRIRTIMQCAGDGIIAIDEHGIVESFNAAAEQIFGYESDEILGRNVSLLMPRPYRDEYDGYIKRYLTSNESHILGERRTLPGLRKDGSVVTLEINISEVPLRDRRLFTGIIRDLTEQQRIEERVASIGRILDDSLNEVYIFDAATLEFQFVNRGARLNLGYTIDELLDLTPLAVQTEFTPDEFRRQIAPIREGRLECLSFSSQHRRKDGSTYPVDVFLHSSSFESRPVIVALVLDCTERFESQQQLAKAQAELQQSEKLASVGQLAAGIAHEINTPIQFVGDNVRACSDMFDELKGVLQEYRRLLETLEPEDCFAESVARIREAEQKADVDFIFEDVPEAFSQTLEGVDRVRKIVQAMKNFARSEADGEKSRVDLNAALADTLTVAGNELKYVADVETDFGETSFVEAHAGELNQVFLNLLINSAHAIQDKGDQRGVIRIRTRAEHSAVVVTISDTGTGIPDDVRNRIFDPFFTTKEVGRGSGQGLAIAHGIVVDRHGGTITCETEPGVGSTFSVSIPVAQQMNGEDEESGESIGRDVQPFLA